MKSILVTESDKKYQISISCRLLSKDILENTSVISTAIENSVFYIKKYIKKNI